MRPQDTNRRRLLSTRRTRSGTLNFGGWILFYSVVGITTRAQAGVCDLVEPNLADRIIELKPVSGRVAVVRLKQQQAKALTWVQVYALNLEAEYDSFLEEAQCALYQVPNTESVILMGDFNAHVAVDAEKRNGAFGENGPRDLNNNRLKLLRLSANNGLL